MQIIVGWDDHQEAETIELCLNVDDHEAQVFSSADEFREAFESSSWDVVLMTLDFPTRDEAFELFRRVRELHPGTPVIGAWCTGEIVHLAKFIRHGLQSYITRDADGEFVFLLLTLIEAAQAAASAERSRILAERLREEVDSVRRLQESVIPRNMPVPDGYKVEARYEPSQISVVGSRPVVMAGGDYYDIFSLDQDRLILLVGDASGHGVKACMSIMTMHTLIRLARDHRHPDTIAFVSEVNRQLCQNEIVNDEGGFITLLYCTLDSKTNRIEWTAAGHPMPLLQDLETNEVVVLGSEEEGGLPLGIDDTWVYQVCSAEMPPNSRLLIYTDGLEEAFPEGSDDAEQFGIEGIINCLKASVNESLDQSLERLFAESNAATKGQGRLDDTSVVLLERA